METLLNIFLEPNDTRDDCRNSLQSNLQDMQDKVLTVFKLPITYNGKKMELNENIINDLELLKSNSSNETISPVYDVIFQPETCFGKNILKLIPKYYTTDMVFLKETQKILNNVNIPNTTYPFPKQGEGVGEGNYNRILEIYTSIKNDNGFLQKYLYIDYEHFLFLNNNELFLQILSMYNVLSPLLTFLIPIFLLIIPFIIIKIQGIPITFETYKKVLYIVISEHSLGKVFTQFNKVEFDKKIYLIISAFFYIFSIYTNVMTCIRFYKNMKYIHDYLEELYKYVKQTIKTSSWFSLISNNMISYSTFNNVLETNISIIKELDEELNKIIFPFSICVKKTMQIGHILKIFYKLHTDEKYQNSLLYSFGFNGYIDILNGVTKNIYKNKKLNYISFLSKKNKHKSCYKKMFYPPLMNCDKVVNDIKLDDNIILTGVNASGKTTILKSVLINTIISQQFGVGCFDKGKLYPFKHIHCYLNILDTSDRYSLFQSECKKCQDIINIIGKDKQYRHLCVFDELFSGTNPEEAIKCGFGFLLFLTKFKNVRFLLTTHFIELSKKFNYNKDNIKKKELTDTINVINKKMESLYNNEGVLIHSYCIKNGINNIKGGIEILKEMNYPEDILDTIKNLGR